MMKDLESSLDKMEKEYSKYGKKDVKYDDEQGVKIKEDCTALVELDLMKEEEGPPGVPECYDSTSPDFPANFIADTNAAFECLFVNVNTPPPLDATVGFHGCVNAAGTGLDSLLNNIRNGMFEPLVFPDCTDNEAYADTIANIPTPLVPTVATQEIIDALNCVFEIPTTCARRTLLQDDGNDDGKNDDNETKEFLQFIDRKDVEERRKIRGGASVGAGVGHIDIHRHLKPDENFIMFKMAMLSNTWNMMDCAALTTV